MADFLDRFNAAVGAASNVLWHPAVLYVLLAAGLLFTFWGGFMQWRSLTHGVAALRGDFDRPDDPGAISHFQALSAALSATVGLGNIGGVALGIALGGPGAVFWMWVVGLLGMALKTAEVTLAMVYREEGEDGQPHGGPMWVVSRGLAEKSPRWAAWGRRVGGLFCISLLVSTATGGNLFQAWNVGEITRQFFGVPTLVTGLVLAVLVALVILGGIHRIGAVTGRLVPFMCAAYVLACLFVIISRYEQIPGVFALILQGAFGPTPAQGAFVGGAAAFAFSTGMQRAFFSNEAGQGSSPIAHAAARTSEPAREGLVAGLEPFIDTLVICTMTALVIFLSGVWNRPPELRFLEPPTLVERSTERWTLEGGRLPAPPSRPWRVGDTVSVHLETAGSRVALGGRVQSVAPDLEIEWGEASAATPPRRLEGVFLGYTAATFTAQAFDRVRPGLGTWLVTLAVWLFGFSTLISWSYYGEQGVVYLAGERWLVTYRLLFCAFIVVACSGLVRSPTELNNLTLLGTGFMLWVNIPITLFFARRAIEAQREYGRRF